MGNAHLVKFAEKVRRTMTPATQKAVAQEDAGVVDEDAGTGPEVDDAAGTGDGEPSVAKDPKKYCWHCKTPDDHTAAKLRVCSGCKRVRYLLLDVECLLT